VKSNHFRDNKGRVGKYDAKVISSMVRSWQHAVGVIGVGNMGAALVRGIANQAEGPSRSVAICDLDQDRVDSLCKDLGVEGMSDAKSVALSSELVILAAKPQNLGAILEQISKSIDPDQTIMSIMAGVTTDALERGLGGNPRVIRVMPNLPALVGQGISVYCGGLHAEALDFQRAEEVLNAVGVCIQGPEELMDPVTALSGTGPAYVFHTMEAMIESGIGMGIPEEMARILVRQTVLGAAMLAKESDLDPTSLREAVTSKGGTTDAAISHLVNHEYTRIVVEAIFAARDRSRELGS
jgi:pyrroline-5-carboxylate reductase